MAQKSARPVRGKVGVPEWRLYGIWKPNITPLLRWTLSSALPPIDLMRQLSQGDRCCGKRIHGSSMPVTRFASNREVIRPQRHCEPSYNFQWIRSFLFYGRLIWEWGTVLVNMLLWGSSRRIGLKLVRRINRPVSVHMLIASLQAMGVGLAYRHWPSHPQHIPYFHPVQNGCSLRQALFSAATYAVPCGFSEDVRSHQ